jgi:hypothetical protein
VRVTIPVGAPLRAALDATKKVGLLILTNSDGLLWTEDGFRSSWRKACAKAGIAGITFNDLRGTAVTRLAVAGCTEAENRNAHRTFASRCEINPGQALPWSKPYAGRECHPETRGPLQQ